MNRIRILAAAIFSICYSVLIGIALPSFAAPTQTIWQSDPATVASLQPEQKFGAYFIKLPKNYSLSTTRKFQEADKWQWHGDLHDDSTRPVIEVWIVPIDSDQANGDTVALGEKILVAASNVGVTNYTRGKDETGIDKITGNWVTRFPSSCNLTSPTGVDVSISAENYVWLDHGKLLLATVYDAAAHSKESIKGAEASIWSVHS